MNLKRSPGAIPHHLHHHHDERCAATVPELPLAGKRERTLRCEYYDGHPGLHYSAGECWAVNGATAHV